MNRQAQRLSILAALALIAAAPPGTPRTPSTDDRNDLAAIRHTAKRLDPYHSIVDGDGRNAEFAVGSTRGDGRGKGRANFKRAELADGC